MTDGGCHCSKDYVVEQSLTGRSAVLGKPIWSNVFKNRMFMELPPSTRTQMSFTSLTMGLTMRGYRPDFSIKPGWLLWSKVMGTSDHFRYSGGV
jgi:hypothetical protein